MKKCIYCGVELADDDNFCYECGKPVDNNSFFKDKSVIEDDDKQPPKSNATKFLIIGFVALLLICGGWYLWDSKKSINLINGEAIVNESSKVKSFKDKIIKVDDDTSKEQENENENDEISDMKFSINMTLSGKVGGEAEMEMQGESGWYIMTYKGADPTKRTLELESFNSTDGQCVLNAYLKGKYIGKFIGRIEKENDSKTIQTYEGIFESVKGVKLDFYFHSN